MALAVGTKAPAFKTQTDKGETINLAGMKGKWVVLYFYPEDDTPTCTVQACDFNSNIDDINALDAVVLGVSPDSVESHEKFKAKFNLNFTLLADENKKICKAYETWGMKNLYGREFMGIIRTTYIINPKGIIAKVYPRVLTKNHSLKVIAALKELQAAK